MSRDLQDSFFAGFAQAVVIVDEFDVVIDQGNLKEFHHSVVNSAASMD